MTPTELLQLNIANAALGIATAICIGMVAWGVISEVFARIRANAALRHDDHAFLVPELGLTMADGGEKVEEEDEEQPK